MMLFMSKQVSLPKFSSILQKNKNLLKMPYKPFLQESLCLLVMIEIRSNILLKTIALKSAVKSKFVLLLKSKSSARTRRNYRRTLE